MDFPFLLHGNVEYGRKLGTKLNIPTANITPLEDVSMITHGVYYSLIIIDGCEYKSITNIGTKPTVQNENIVNVETFIYDFEGDLYGKDIVVSLLEFRRPEKKFADIDELSKTMHEDLEAGRVYQIDNNGTIS